MPVADYRSYATWCLLGWQLRCMAIDTYYCLGIQATIQVLDRSPTHAVGRHCILPDPKVPNGAYQTSPNSRNAVMATQGIAVFIAWQDSRHFKAANWWLCGASINVVSCICLESHLAFMLLRSKITEPSVSSCGIIRMIKHTVLPMWQAWQFSLT